MSHAIPLSPIWVLTHRGEAPWRPVVLGPGYAAAFSSQERAAAFAGRSHRPDWEFRLVSARAFPGVADGFRGHGVVGLALDPADDGNWTAVDWDDIVYTG